jgi:hypothetical protein
MKGKAVDSAAFPALIRHHIGIVLPSRSLIVHWAPLPLRLIVGCGFMEHGIAKLTRGSDVFAAIWDSIEPTQVTFRPRLAMLRDCDPERVQAD